jgi:hypothetical protein
VTETNTTDLTNRVSAVTVPVKVLALLTFLGALFLDWQRVTVDVAGVVHVEETTIGWNGWGFLAGLIALALLTLMFADAPRSTTGEVLVSGFVPGALVLATALAVFTGDADTSIAGAVAVEVDTSLWPAWLGLALAVIAAGAYLVELFFRLPRPRTHHLARPTPA